MSLRVYGLELRLGSRQVNFTEEGVVQLGKLCEIIAVSTKGLGFLHCFRDKV